MTKTKQGLLIVISGPSGAGKGTVLSSLLKGCEDTVISVSATTRKPREGEKNGQNYYFLSREEFEELIRSDGILEYAEYCGNLYGTPRRHVEERLQMGINVILEIEVQGAAQVVEKCKGAVTIFLMPPSLAELEARLRGRGTEAEEVIQKRVAAAQQELLAAPNYDYIIINDEVEKAAAEINALITAEKQKLH
ncbi:MAG: guanylate kinase [Oscillospiraceae bacterium]|nr:guanylate kinase [Oscillospiraceae bacterium]